MVILLATCIWHSNIHLNLFLGRGTKIGNVSYYAQVFLYLDSSGNNVASRYNGRL